MEHDPSLPEQHADEIEKEVREHVEHLKGFYIHLGIYLLINLLLIAINLLTSPGRFWAIFPLLGWGMGLGGHAIGVFGLFGIGGKTWEDRKVRELMLQRQHGLTAEQVRQVMRDELQREPPGLSATSNEERILRRLENLEAIVTSKDWDALDDTSKAGYSPLVDLDPAVADEEETSNRASRIARRIK